jgi:predicted MPP superfamily phosphohydrolase
MSAAQSSRPRRNFPMRFLLPPSLIVALLHVYLWRRLVRDTQLPRSARRAASVALTLLAASIPLSFVAWGTLGRSSSPVLSAIAFGWLGVTMYLLGFLVVGDVLRVAIWIAERLRPRPASVALERPLASQGGDERPALAEPPVRETPALSGLAPRETPAAAELKPDETANVLGLARETRRVFVARVAAGSALAAAAGIGAFGVRSALWDITQPEVPVALPRFPRALDGYTIALLSDIHIGPLLDGRFLRHVVEQTNRARPDLIAIVGDLVDGRVAEIGAQVAELRGLRARDGVCFVTGNHEYYSGGLVWVDFLRKLGLRVLMNQRVSLGDDSVHGASFDLAGIPDHRAGTTSPIGPDARRATLGRDPERELVMLAHQPIQIADTASVGTGLQLSGHTHGGQIYPFGAITLLAQPYLAGLHRHEPSGTQVYVSRGTGFWGPPMRVSAPSEISLVRLHST